MKTIRIILILLALPLAAFAIDVCQVTPPTASLTVPYVSGSPQLNTDPHSPTWATAASAWIEKECTDKLSYPELKTEVRGFWTDTDLYLLFVSPYKVLNLWQPPDNIFAPQGQGTAAVIPFRDADSLPAVRVEDDDAGTVALREVPEPPSRLPRPQIFSIL